MNQQNSTLTTTNSNLSNRIDELNHNMQPDIQTSFFSNAFGYYGSSEGLSAKFSGIATSTKIAFNTYRIDVDFYMNVVAAPEDYFSYGVYAATICQKLLGKLPVIISSGQCDVYDSDGTLAVDIVGYGARLLYQDKYVLNIGRYYKDDGTYGSWALDKFIGGHFLKGFFFVQI